MKKILAMLLAVMMVLTMASVAMAAEEGGLLTTSAAEDVASPVEEIEEKDILQVGEDGNLAGVIEGYEGVVEVYVNGKKAAVGVNGAEINFPVGDEDLIVEVYVNGMLVDTFKVAREEEPQAPGLDVVDGSVYATGNVEGVYARVAVAYVMDDGETGLIVSEGIINVDDDGLIVIPFFEFDGLSVVGVNVALVTEAETITTPTPSVVVASVSM